MANITPSAAEQMRDSWDAIGAKDVIGDFFDDLPPNWGDLVGELAWFFHWPPSELRQLTVNQLWFWHGQARRMYEGTHGEWLSSTWHLVVRTVDQATAPLRRIQKSVRDISQHTGLDKVRRGIRSVRRRMRRVGEAAAGFAKKVGLIAGALGALIGLPALRAYSTIERLQTSFESMLGSTAAAAAMVKALTEFSAKTPFQLEGIGSATKSLLAFGVEGDAIVEKLQFLGDIAAGAGVPLNDLAQIYGKAMAKGKAQTEELNQMSERGVPILQALVDLAAKYGNEISKEDVYKAAEKGQITFKAVEEALQLMTAEGGIFNEQMKRQSKTMAGLGSTVKDNVFLAFAELGEQIEKTFEVKQGMRDFTKWLQNLTKELKKPRGEQEGFAMALTESLHMMDSFAVGVSEVVASHADSIKQIHGAYRAFIDFFKSTAGGIFDFFAAAGSFFTYEPPTLYGAAASLIPPSPAPGVLPGTALPRGGPPVFTPLAPATARRPLVPRCLTPPAPASGGLPAPPTCQAPRRCGVATRTSSWSSVTCRVALARRRGPTGTRTSR